MIRLSDFVTFADRRLAKRYPDGTKIPMSTLFEAYFDGALDLPEDLDEFLGQRNELVTYDITRDHWKFFFTRFIPEVAIHSKAQDRRIVRDHYDRGNDFFGAFLGERMVYTCGIFRQGPSSESLEDAQDNKLELVCRKLMLKPGDSLLDIGCGWGTAIRYAASRHGVDATGITIAERQTEYGNARIREDGLDKQARVLCLDYRDIPERRFDKIVSLEMVEHVGIKNFSKFLRQVYGLLQDNGLFLMQWTGLRRGGDLGVPVIGLRPEDLIWGLFMNKYIFSGADASLPLSDAVRAMEKVGFEIHSAENITVHYGHTIRKWYENWLVSKPEVVRKYGERWFRVWQFFLAWSTYIAAQGNAACFQVLANKNLDHFDRNIFIGYQGVGSLTESVAEAPQRLRRQSA